MTAVDPLVALDELTDGLPEAADHLGRRVERLVRIGCRVPVYLDEHGQLRVDGDIVCPVCLTGPCDCLTDRDPPRPPVVVGGALVCSWCLENAGWCTATGGTHPCEGAEEHVEAVADAYNAPELHIRVGGAR